MRKIDPRIQQLLASQRKGLAFMFILSLIVPPYLSFAGFGEITFMSIAVAFLGFYVTMKMGSFFITLYLQQKFYPGDSDAFIQDALDAAEILREKSKKRDYSEINSDDENTPVEPMAFEIEIVDKPEKPLGSFQDAPIYEWLDVKIDGDEVYRLEYDAVVEIREGEPIFMKPGSVMLAPGIIYSIKTQDDEENK